MRDVIATFYIGRIKARGYTVLNPQDFKLIEGLGIYELLDYIDQPYPDRIKTDAIVYRRGYVADLFCQYDNSDDQVVYNYWQNKFPEVELSEGCCYFTIRVYKKYNRLQRLVKWWKRDFPCAKIGERKYR